MAFLKAIPICKESRRTIHNHQRCRMSATTSPDFPNLKPNPEPSLFPSLSSPEPPTLRTCRPPLPLSPQDKQGLPFFPQKDFTCSSFMPCSRRLASSSHRVTYFGFATPRHLLFASCTGERALHGAIFFSRSRSVFRSLHEGLLHVSVSVIFAEIGWRMHWRGLNCAWIMCLCVPGMCAMWKFVSDGVIYGHRVWCVDRFLFVSICAGG